MLNELVQLLVYKEHGLKMSCYAISSTPGRVLGIQFVLNEYWLNKLMDLSCQFNKYIWHSEDVTLK